MRRLWLLVVLCVPWVCAAQGHHWELSVNGSYMMTNDSKYFRYNTFGFGADVAWWYRATGEEWWMQRRHYPSFGLKASYEHFPTGVAGDRFGVVALVRTPLLKWLEWNIGPGLSLYTHPGNHSGNEENIFISSRLNCLIDLGLTAHVSEDWTIGLRLLHTSSGMLSRPNQGLNFVQLDVGIQLKGDTSHAFFSALQPPPFKRHEVGVMLSGGLTMSRYALMYGYYPCYDVSLNYLYYLDPVLAVGATLDVWYNGTHEWLKGNYRVEWHVPMYISMMPMVEGFWGPLSIKAGIGPMLWASDLVRIRFYERVGAYYNWKRYYVGVGLNAHAGQVEFVEWSFGLRFKV